ncbi:hypothetical protein LZ30DRAFT_14903 [Colletotrichum cereale]|nr:hypothetical protein LZ30DRAFT_14903 [Colletotrichum cereale]
MVQSALSAGEQDLSLAILCETLRSDVKSLLWGETRMGAVWPAHWGACHSESDQAARHHSQYQADLLRPEVTHARCEFSYWTMMTAAPTAIHVPQQGFIIIHKSIGKIEGERESKRGEPMIQWTASHPAVLAAVPWRASHVCGDGFCMPNVRPDPGLYPCSR